MANWRKPSVFAVIVVALVTVMVGCATTTPSLWAKDPLPTYTETPFDPDLDQLPDPALEVPVAVGVDAGEVLELGGVLDNTPSYLEASHLTDVVLPEVREQRDACWEMAEADRAFCDRDRAAIDTDRDYWRAEAILGRVAVVVVAVGAAAAVAAAFTGGYQLGAGL